MIQTVRNFIFVMLVPLAVAGCAGIGGPPLQPGTPESGVVERLGTPSHVLQNPDGSARILEYMNGPFGQTTYFARIGVDGRLISYEQVLTTAKFAEITVGVSTKADVTRTIGTPSETSYLALPKLEVWTYPYKESPVSDSMMYVHFDSAGIVRKMLNGPDLRRDGNRRGMFGSRH